jgi:hypothetical protein
MLTVIVVTIGIPFLVLVADYMYRVDAGMLDVMRTAGPDLCLLGLGSVGAIFIDPRVASAFTLPPQLAGVIVTVVIFMLRGICFRFGKNATGKSAFATMLSGLASITIVGAILIYSYSQPLQSIAK